MLTQRRLTPEPSAVMLVYVFITALEAAEILGISRGQIYAHARGGLLSSVRIGHSVLVPERQLFALEAMDLQGRRWGQKRWQASLEALSKFESKDSPTRLSNRFMNDLLSLSDASLAGRLLAGRVLLYQGSGEQRRTIGSSIATEAGLTGEGTAVLASWSASAAAEELGLEPDPEGNVIAIEANGTHRDVLEAVVFIVYGSTREQRAGRNWLAARRSTLANGKTPPTQDSHGDFLKAAGLEWPP